MISSLAIPASPHFSSCLPQPISTSLAGETLEDMCSASTPAIAGAVV
jgi:hypothetical protein